MTKRKLSLFLFADAFGWELLKRHPHFLSGQIADQKPLRTILGYSSACDPSIISGRFPEEHGQWSSFYYSPHTCPYKWVKYLSWLPKKITDSARVRHRLSRMIATVHRFSGYFEIYNLPFKCLPLFDYAEKKWMWGTKNGLVAGNSIFDLLLEEEVPFYVNPSVTVTEEQQWRKAIAAIRDEKISFAYLMLGKLDAVMHAEGTKGDAIDRQIARYDHQIRTLLQLAENHYEEVVWYIFSDHGMHDVTEPVDIQKEIAATGFKFGKDFTAVYDSTMARFWWLNDHCKQAVHNQLSSSPHGRWLTDKELKQEHVYFPDKKYGESIFLLDGGKLIIPSFMGKKPIPGMHGYHPNEPDSTAMIASNQRLPQDLTSIEQIFWLMVEHGLPARGTRV